MAAKRSPILGYNHNVRYRGLVFHVQTEDSGVLSPHLFTHLFHGGVIVSTRKLVYDSGSAEESIKSLMQSQHKAVLKDLKKGSFDDKIDAYLGGTPGLLPRGSDAGEPDRTEPLERIDIEPADASPTATAQPVQPAQPVQTIQAPITLVSVPAIVEMPPPALSGPTLPSIPPSTIPPPLRQSGSQAAVVVSPPGTRTSTPTGPTAIPQLPRAGTPISQPNAVPTARAGNTGSQPTASRTITAERTSPSMRAVTPLSVPLVSSPVKPVPPSVPPPPEDDPPTFLDHTSAVASALQNARTRQDLGPPMPSDFQVDSSPEIEMTLEVDDDSGEIRVSRPHTPSHPRAHRDTEVSPVIENESSRPHSDGIPRIVPAIATAPAPARLPPDSIPPVPAASERRVGASALPPTKTVTRPPAVAVVSRPLSNADARERNESDAIEVYAPPPSSVPDPPGPAERPGQYSLRRSKPVAVQPEPPPPPLPPMARERSTSEAPRERTGGVPIPAGLSRPGAKSRPFAANATIPEPPSTPPPQPQRRSDQMNPLNPAASRPGFRNPSESSGLPSALPNPNNPNNGLSNSGIRRNTPLPQPAVAAPPPPLPIPPDHAHLQERTRTPTPARISPTRPHPSGPSPVVMTRPAVIVGAPTKTQPRVRKAREEEQGSRGFGQGLISEKSLDEVILAYLSEDAEDK